MTDDPKVANPDEHEFEEVLAAYYEAAEHGSAPDRQILVDRHPELAANLIEFFAIQDQMHRLAEPLRMKFPQLSNDPVASGPTERDSAAARVVQAIPFLPILENGGGFDDYELLDLIARGAMGLVLRARQKSLNRLVALKVLRDGAGATVEDARRFRNEAEAVANLDHPHIVPIYEVGDSHGCSFFSMKLIEGGDLADRLEEFTQDPRATARLVASVARAVQHAHDRGILHRDLKPSNILIDDRGNPLVADFGLARRLEGDSDLTRTGAMLGTPAYMSPEQASGRKDAVTVGTDVHGLGAILYTILASQPPFRGDSPLQTLELVREHAPVPPRTIRPSTDRGLETICLKCLEKDPKQRYASAAAVADDLDRWLAGRSILARPASRAKRAWRLSRRHPRASALVATVIVLMMTSVAGLVIGSRARETAARLDQEVRSQERTLRRQQYVRDVKQSSQFWVENRTGEALKLLDRYIPTSANGDSRDFAWHYLHRLCDVGRLPLLGHRGDVYFAAFSPDGKTLATASKDRTVRLWDIESRATRATLTGHSDEVNWVAFAPDGGSLATASDDGTARLWDLATGQVKAVLSGDGDQILAAIYTPDGGQVISCGRKGKVWVWDARTFKERDSFAVSNGRLESLAISPDGATIALAGAGVVLWDRAGRGERRRLNARFAPVSSVAFSRDGRSLATVCWSTANVWDISTGELKRTLSTPPGSMESVAFAPDDRLIVWAGHDGFVGFWDPASGQSDRIASGQGRIWCVAFSPDGRIVATASGDGTVKLWDTERDREWISIPAPASNHLSFAFSPDGSRFAMAVYADVLWTYETHSSRLIAKPRIDAGGIVQASILLRDAGSLVTTDNHGTIAFWDVLTGRLLRKFPGPTIRPGFRLAISADGRWVAGVVPDHNVFILDTTNGSWRRLEEDVGDRITVFLDGECAIWGDGARRPYLWDPVSGRSRRPTYPGHRLSTSAGALSPDAKTLATASEDGTVILWDVESLDCQFRLNAHTDGVTAVAFSPDGRTLATGGGDRLVRIWDLSSRSEIATLEGHTGGIVYLGFSPDGLALASSARAKPGGIEVMLRSASPREPALSQNGESTRRRDRDTKSRNPR